MYIQKITTNQWVGIEEHPEEPRKLVAGKLSIEFLNGRIANLAVGGQVFVSEVYYALRDYNWGTIPYTIKSISISEGTDSFKIDFLASHESEGVKFNWVGAIEGTADSCITYSFDGVSESDFLRNRIGFCVLHHAACAGMDCEIKHSDGKEKKSKFPLEIAPHQPFFDIRKITAFPRNGAGIEVSFEGDEFEMEDQRNWTDASFKIYCTPLSRPFPVAISCGDRVSQSLTIKLVADTTAQTDGGPKVKTAESCLTEFEQVKLHLGSCITKPLTQKQMQRVKELKLSHLRYDLHFCEQEQNLKDVMEQARQLDTEILLAVFFTDKFYEEANYLLELLSKTDAKICGISVYMQDAKVTPIDLLLQVRSVLAGLNISIGSGTDAFFTQLNREPLPPDAMDFVCYSNNPQVHAFDNQSMMSTIDGQLANIESCKMHYPDIPCFVSPITMKMRWNPDATALAVTPKGQMPRDVEPRQMSLFAASWFIKSVAAMIKGGKVSLSTYFELVGKKGIMENEIIAEDYPFPTVEGMKYPLYFAFWSLRDLQNSLVRTSISEDTATIWLKKADRTSVVISNITDRAVRCVLDDFPEAVRGFVLDEDNIEAMSNEADEPRTLQRFKNYNENGEISLKRYALFVAEI